jgi:hypothetical protein
MKKLIALLFIIASTSFAGNLGHGLSYNITRTASSSKKCTFISFSLKNSSERDYISVDLVVHVYDKKGKKLASKNTLCVGIDKGTNKNQLVTVPFCKDDISKIVFTFKNASFEDKSLTGKLGTAIKRQKLRWFGFKL